MTDGKIIASILVAAVSMFGMVTFYVKHRTDTGIAKPATQISVAEPISVKPAISKKVSVQSKIPTSPKAADAMTAQELSDEVKKFAPILVQRMKDEDKLRSRPADPTVTRSTTYSVVFTDVQKTNSLIDPMVGMIAISVVHMYQDKQFTSIGYVRKETFTATIAVSGPNTWKCLHGERKIEDHYSYDSSAPKSTEIGQVSDQTEYLRRMIEVN